MPWATERNRRHTANAFPLAAMPESMKSICNRILYLLSFWTIMYCSPPTTAELLFNGNKFFDQKKYDSAIIEYSKVIVAHKDLMQAYINKGKSQEFLGNFQDAEETYTSYLKLTPNKSEVLTRRGITYFKLHKFQEALDDLTKSNNLTPDDPETLSNLGLTKIKLQDFSGMKDLDKAVAYGRKDYMIYYNRGIAKFITNDILGSITDYETSISLNSDFEQAYAGIGISKFKLGDKEGACKYWTLALQKGYTKIKDLIDLNCH